MKHFKTEEWIDFVNHLTSQSRQEAMQKHLASGCQDCTAQMDLWQKVRGMATAEPANQPPGQALRNARALFSTAGWAGAAKNKAGVLELLFDSFLQPALSGARAASSGARQMLFRADSLQIDLQIEAKPGSGHILVTGQVLDVARPEIIGSGLYVTLSNRQGNVVHTLTNQFGEFHMEMRKSGDLELSVCGDQESPIVIFLKDPFADLPEGEK